MSIAKDLNSDYDYPPAGAGPEDQVPTANEVAAFQGYRIGGALGAAGCAATTEPGSETANMRELYIQAGHSPLFGAATVANIWTDRRSLGTTHSPTNETTGARARSAGPGQFASVDS